MTTNDNETGAENEITSLAEEHHGQDLTKGPIGRQLWQLAWPIMLSIFFYTLYNIVDAFWVSKISAEAIAAVSISQIALFVMVALSMGITVGSGVVMSMHIGAKNLKEAERTLGQSFVLSGILALFFTVVSLIWREEVLIASGASGMVFSPALEYFTITAGGSILLFIMMTIVFAYNAQGDNFTPTKLFAVSTLINAVLDPILIFGWFGLPELGIAGAAFATLISQAIFIALAMYFLASEKMMIPFRFSNLTIRLESVKKVLNIGLPAALTQVINPIGAAALLFITARSFAEAGTIAFSIGFRIEFFAYLPAIGFGFGSMALIGQNMGAGNFSRAREAFNKALLYGSGTAIAIGVMAMLSASTIVRVFTTDPVVTQYVASYIVIIALSYGFLAAMMVIVSGFQAIGKSWPGFWLFVIRFALVSIPASYLLTVVYDLPIESLWIAIAGGNVVSALIGYFWINRTLNNMKEIDVPVHPEQPVVV